MSHYDVFNGDADGLCSLQQLRLYAPIDDAILITGVKREIDLLQRVQGVAGDTITVLDVSLDKNREALMRLLEAGCHIDYFDHHFAGDIPSHPALSTTIDTSAESCTSLLINHAIEGAHAAWAVVGAFGDNFHDAARQAAATLSLSGDQLLALNELGTLINYNGYGFELDDLIFHPDALAKAMRPYHDPLDFIAGEKAFAVLQEGYRSDMAHAESQRPEECCESCALVILPDEPWARRVSGVYSNLLARVYPDRAHAILTRMHNGNFRVSVRAPLHNRINADVLCREFPGGGGRAAAAGINELPQQDYERFTSRFHDIFKRP